MSYRVNDASFDTFLAAVDFAKANSAEVFEIATGLRRWAPAPKAKARVKHVLVNADGSETEFRNVKKNA